MAAEVTPDGTLPRDDYEAEERLAIQSETTLAVRQTIPQAQMVAGLMATAGPQ